jgi:hypothetical protein
MVGLLRDLLGLRVEFEETTTTELSLPSGDRVQVFGPGDQYFEFFGQHASGPVALFEVDDVQAARAELLAARVEVVGEIEPRQRLGVASLPGSRRKPLRSRQSKVGWRLIPLNTRRRERDLLERSVPATAEHARTPTLLSANLMPLASQQTVPGGQASAEAAAHNEGRPGTGTRAVPAPLPAVQPDVHWVPGIGPEPGRWAHAEPASPDHPPVRK